MITMKWRIQAYKHLHGTWQFGGGWRAYGKIWDLELGRWQISLVKVTAP